MIYSSARFLPEFPINSTQTAKSSQNEVPDYNLNGNIVYNPKSKIVYNPK